MPYGPVPELERATEPPRASAQAGFTFLGLMFIIALMGLLATAASTTWQFASQRDREIQLLFAGHAYREAIVRYAAAHARQSQPYPTELADLLQDPAQLLATRYLRRLYFDPMTGRNEWGLERNTRGGITGVYSLSSARPIRGGHSPDLAHDDFGDAQTYRDWVFSAVGTAKGAGPAASGAASDDDPENRLTRPPPLPPRQRAVDDE